MYRAVVDVCVCEQETAPVEPERPWKHRPNGVCEWGWGSRVEELMQRKQLILVCSVVLCCGQS